MLLNLRNISPARLCGLFQLGTRPLSAPVDRSPCEGNQNGPAAPIQGPHHEGNARRASAAGTPAIADALRRRRASAPIASSSVQGEACALVGAEARLASFGRRCGTSRK